MNRPHKGSYAILGYGQFENARLLLGVTQGRAGVVFETGHKK